MTILKQRKAKQQKTSAIVSASFLDNKVTGLTGRQFVDFRADAQLFADDTGVEVKLSGLRANGELIELTLIPRH